MARTNARYGWVPQLGDQRDFVYKPEATKLPQQVDLRSLFPKPYDQDQLGSCHDDQTEVLTREGWKLFADVTLDDHLASVDPESTRLIYERPKRIIRMPYQGVMHRGQHQNIDFQVTPDHQMLVRPWVEKERRLSTEYDLVPMKDVGWYAGLMSGIHFDGEDKTTTYTLSGVDAKHRPQREDLTIPMETWLQFLGIYLAEGTLLRQKPGEMYKIQIAASTSVERAFIRSILKVMNQHALELPDRFTINSQRLYEALAELGLAGVKAPDKFVPLFVFRLPSEQIKHFLLGHFMGDGCEQNGLKSHYTSSKKLADDIQRLIFLSGSWGNLRQRPPRTSRMLDGRIVRGRYPEYRVSMWSGKRGISIDRKANIEPVFYDGEVFCAEVPTFHTLVTRRNGAILISGNCTANAIAGLLEYLRRVEGEADFIPSRLFIYYYERVLEGTVSSDAGAMLRDGIKVVATQGAPNEADWPYDITKFKNAPSAKVVGEAQTFEAIQYQAVPQTATALMGALAAGHPVVFGFTVYESFESPEVASTGVVPYPRSGESALGGHAVCIVGYDAVQKVFIVRNSYGEQWGQAGHFTLPFRYVVNKRLASDFWVITKTT